MSETLTRRLRICSYNIHKGFSQFNRRMVVHELREQLRGLDADVVFLQEVQGLHLGHQRRHPDWPAPPQHEFLAEAVWRDTAYGRNAVYDHGHHGNAILSRLPILVSSNHDVSDHRFEQRGLLHCVLSLPGSLQPLHCFCVHLGLMAGSRRRQMLALAARIEQAVPAQAPLIIAGDFNDWRNKAKDLLVGRLGVEEVFHAQTGRLARSFPARLPLLRLDRIYVRGMKAQRPEVLSGRPWSAISDHAVLSVELALESGA